jgi:AmmeMemoRadiSam system protein B
MPVPARNAFQYGRVGHRIDPPAAMTTIRSIYRTRPPAVAGAFYPASREALRAAVARRLDAARATPRPRLRGVIAPHAGYAYSGAVAAEAFAATRALTFARALVIGPAHYVPIRGLAAPSHAAFATPLGEVPVEDGAVRTLAREGLAAIDDEPHAPEHAIEVELPFLQTLFGELPVVPLLFGAADARIVAQTLVRLWTDDTLLVVSSDLSHFEPYATACAHDARTAAAIERLDEAAIGPRDACGHLAVRGALIEAKRRGLAVERLELTNSGDTAGGRDSVVGYGAWALLGA